MPPLVGMLVSGLLLRQLPPPYDAASFVRILQVDLEDVLKVWKDQSQKAKGLIV